MTCIIGLVLDGNVFIGGDSSAASGWTVRSTAIEKVFRKGPFIIGYTTSFRMGQILQYEIDYSEDLLYDEEYMVTKFIPTIREKFKLLGFTEVENSKESGGDFLVGVKGKLYHIGSDFQVNSYTDGMIAIGVGAEFGLGALEALIREENCYSAQYLIEIALDISAYFSGAVKAPFIILEGS